MRPIFIRATSLLLLTSSSLGQFLPVSLYHRQPPGCQFSSVTEGAYIYFNHPDGPYHYSIATPWTRFYPDALRADLAAQGFQLVAQHGENNQDACGWETVDTVKKNGWLRGTVSYRYISGGGVKVTHAAETKLPSNMPIPLNPHANRTAANVASHVANYMRRDDSAETSNSKPAWAMNIQIQGPNETLDDTSSVAVSHDGMSETVTEDRSHRDKPCDTYRCATLKLVHDILQVPGVFTLINAQEIDDLLEDSLETD